MNNRVCSGLSILGIIKLVISMSIDMINKNKIWRKISCYMDTDSFVVFIKTENMYSENKKGFQQDLILQIINQTDHCLKQKLD